MSADGVAAAGAPAPAPAPMDIDSTTGAAVEGMDTEAPGTSSAIAAENIEAAMPTALPAEVVTQSGPEELGGRDDGVESTIPSAKPAFLHSPPDSNEAHKSEQSDSELSDLDEPPEVGEEFRNELRGKVKETEKGETKEEETKEEAKQETRDGDDKKDDIGEIEPDHWENTVPVFKPTMHQFKDFKIFMEKIDKYGMRSGIVKIVPPAEWKESLPPYDDLVKQIRVREPIKQDIMGSNGTYRQVNILHGRSYNLPQWRHLCDQSEHQPPARRGERRATRDRPKPAPKPKTERVPKPPKSGRGRGRPRKNKPAEEHEGTDRPMTPVSPKPDADEVKQSIEEDVGVKFEEEEQDARPPPGRMGGMRQSKPKYQSTSARRKYSKREGSAMIDEKAFENFDYKMDVSDYTAERCEELERIYWKTLTYAPPLYGADLLGTLFHDETESWNLNRLPNLLDVLGTQVPGVNTAYLYLGMWKATFAWHLEDVDLYSINYLHFGAPKQWYSISQADARKFEAAMKNIWPTDAKACDQFLRHKAFLISPTHLQQHYGIKVNKCLSFPGEFVVTYPYGYHSGFNLGYNCAEAVNFALDSWMSMGKIAKRCECAQAQDSVWIDVYEIERRLRGEETEYDETEDEEEEDDDDLTGLPTPPASSRVKVRAPTKKRKRTALDKGEGGKAKKIKLRVKARAEPPCCLCPNDIPHAEILPTDDGRKAHRMCALYIPETYIDTVDNAEIVANVANISKERLDLKCLYCRSKRGACFQCSQKKCARAYHATCAAAAGVFVEEEDVPVFGEDGTEYKEQAFEFSCRFHRVKRDRKLEGPDLEGDERIRSAAKALEKGAICQMQYYRGEIFAGVVVENREDEETLLLDVIPNGDRVEVEWKWLLLADPTDYHLPKASAKAVPLPPSKKAKEQLNAKRAEGDTPRKDDAFVEGYTWAEFTTRPDWKHPEQARVDLEKADRLWYYLPESSTEAKPQYTENPARRVYNTKSNFLDSVPKPPKPAPQPRRSLSTVQHTPGVPSAVGAIRFEKPYVYKPRNPVEPNRGSSSMHAPQGFSPQAGGYGGDPRYQVSQHTPSQFTASIHQARPDPWAEQNGRPAKYLARDKVPAIAELYGRYPFFQSNYNRESSSHRTPYATDSGFTNGYEGNIRAFYMSQGQYNWNAARQPGFPGSKGPTAHSISNPPVAGTSPITSTAAYWESLQASSRQQPVAAMAPPQKSTPTKPKPPPAPKPQYKPPAKQTPVPIPTKYLAAMGGSSAGSSPASKMQTPKSESLTPGATAAGSPPATPSAGDGRQDTPSSGKGDGAQGPEPATNSTPGAMSHATAMQTPSPGSVPSKTSSSAPRISTTPVPLPRLPGMASFTKTVAAAPTPTKPALVAATQAPVSSPQETRMATPVTQPAPSTTQPRGLGHSVPHSQNISQPAGQMPQAQTYQALPSPGIQSQAQVAPPNFQNQVFSPQFSHPAPLLHNQNLQRLITSTQANQMLPPPEPYLAPVDERSLVSPLQMPRAQLPQLPPLNTSPFPSPSLRHNGRPAQPYVQPHAMQWQPQQQQHPAVPPPPVGSAATKSSQSQVHGGNSWALYGELSDVGGGGQSADVIARMMMNLRRASEGPWQ